MGSRNIQQPKAVEFDLNEAKSITPSPGILEGVWGVDRATQRLRCGHLLRVEARVGLHLQLLDGTLVGAFAQNGSVASPRRSTLFLLLVFLFPDSFFLR